MHLIRREKSAAASRIAIVAVMTLAVAAGCRKQASVESPGSPAASSDSKVVADKGQPVPGGKSVPIDQGEPLLADWKSPAAVLLLTGEQHGYLEPCGCSIHQLGGMARRADLVRILTEERKWPVAGLDVGGVPKRDRRQDQIKYLALFDAFKMLNYSAVAIGLEELKLGADFLLQQQVSDPEEMKKAVALMGANVALYDPPLEGWPIASRIVQVGTVKVGVSAIVGLSLRNEVAPVGAMSNITIRDSAEVLPAVITALQAEKPDFLVLLSHGSVDEAKQLSEKFPAFRIILTAGGPEEPDKKPVVVGNTWIVQAGTKGKRVGVLGYFPDNKTESFRYDLVTLDDVRFKNDPRMRELMKTYQQQLLDEAVATSDELLFKHPSGHAFVGAEKCGECHTKAFEHWKKTTPHAKAFTTLITGRDGDADPISRIHDPECLACHVTGWEPQQMLRYDTGFVSKDRTPHLLHQQCENCHGPGSLHVGLQEKFSSDAASVPADELKAGQASVRRTLAQAQRGDCAKCHDSDNDPHFTPDAFDKYWQKVKHPWRD
jgi:cytochrome c554/c'-like protein